MDNVDEQIDAVTRSVLALTVSCARCHDHKFDPIPTTDYYALAGIFTSTDNCAGVRNKMGGGGLDYYDPSMLVALAGDVPAPPAETGREAQGRAGEGEEGMGRHPWHAGRAGQGAERYAQTATVPPEIRGTAGRVCCPHRPGGRAVSPSTGARRQDGRRHGGAHPRRSGEARPDRAARLSDRVRRAGRAARQSPSRAAAWNWPSGSPARTTRSRRAWPSTASGSTCSAGGSSARSTTSASRVTGRRTPSCSITWQRASSATAGRSRSWSGRIVLSRSYQLSTPFAIRARTSHRSIPANRLVWRHTPRRLDAEEMRDAMLATAGTLTDARPQGSPAQNSRWSRCAMTARRPRRSTTRRKPAPPQRLSAAASRRHPAQPGSLRPGRPDTRHRPARHHDGPRSGTVPAQLPVRPLPIADLGRARARPKGNRRRPHCYALPRDPRPHRQ